jgi:hypothetical protein
MKLFTRLRLFFHVLANGCRIVDVAKLDCESCEHEPICNQGYYDPRTRQSGLKGEQSASAVPLS